MLFKLQLKKYISTVLSCLLILLVLIPTVQAEDATTFLEDQGYTLRTEYPLEIPNLSKEQDYIELNDNIPYFSDEDLTNTEPWITFTELDQLKRVGPANAVLNTDLMPAIVRQDASRILPTGWQQNQYQGEYLYNRSHLLGFQLIGDGILPLNLMTGTKQFNNEGMLPFEDYVAFIVESGLTVRYRVTPYFIGDNLLAHGVIMEGFSIEDNGASLNFNIFVPNRQDGVSIDYGNGDNSDSHQFNQATVAQVPTYQEPETILYYDYQRDGSLVVDHPVEEDFSHHDHNHDDAAVTTTYIVNANTGKFHFADCSSVDDMAEHNKVFLDDYDLIISQGYVPCKRCNPK